ncbi:hypothetical protein N9B73_09465 [Verrucomicrobiales bacterium]|nr:hypothetical protein [Verrucomicrobiales bacterium]
MKPDELPLTSIEKDLLREEQMQTYERAIQRPDATERRGLIYSGYKQDEYSAFLASISLVAMGVEPDSSKCQHDLHNEHREKIIDAVVRWKKEGGEKHFRNVSEKIKKANELKSRNKDALFKAILKKTSNESVKVRVQILCLELVGHYLRKFKRLPSIVELEKDCREVEVISQDDEKYKRSEFNRTLKQVGLDGLPTGE